MTEDLVTIEEYEGREYEIFKRMGKPMDCDGCDNKIKKGDLYTQSDAGDNYCEGCSTE